MLSPGHGHTVTSLEAKRKSEGFKYLVNDKKWGTPGYLIYRYKGEIRVKKGIKGRYVFYPDNQPYSWMTNCPERFGEVTSAGRILVKHENDILEGVEMLREHYRKKIENVQHTSSTTIKNIIECTESTGYVIK